MEVMAMLLRQMEYFLAAVTYKSFSEAAKQCYVSQPAFSFQIKQLEEEIGVKLINRNNCRFSLTTAGEKFYEPCKKIVSEIHALKNNMQEEAEKYSIPQYKIGCRTSYNVRYILSTVNRLNKHTVAYHIDVVYGDHWQMMSMLENHELDMVISSDRPYKTSRLCSEVIDNLGLAVCVPQHSPLAKKTSVNTEDLKGHTCCLVVDHQFEEQEKKHFQQLLNFNGNFYIAGDLLSSITKVINDMGPVFMPVADNKNIQQYCSGLTKLLPLSKNGEVIKIPYKIFWLKNNSKPEIESIVHHIIDLIYDH